MKYLLIGLVGVLVLYGPVELTRLIVDYIGRHGGEWYFWGEIGMMWLLYIGAMFTLSVFMKVR